MRLPLFQLDAFTMQPFAGNPAAVLVLPFFPPDAVLQAVAAENNLAETAFLVRDGERYQLRWFTPLQEVPLCGHATLASAAVVLQRLQPERDEVVFDTLSGALTVRRSGSGYVLDFPARAVEPVEPPAALIQALGCQPREVFVNAHAYLAVLDSARSVRELQPNLRAIAALDRGGVIVTAAGDGDHDCVSRYFAPAKGIDEDPVTGSAHCAIAPFWGARLGKNDLRAWQASRRGGEILCRLRDGRVAMEGGCVFYLEGEIELPISAPELDDPVPVSADTRTTAAAMSGSGTTTAAPPGADTPDNTTQIAEIATAKGTYQISSENSRLDLDAIHAYLSRSYWSAGIPRALVATAIAHSRCFGLYAPDGAQVGFARVVTDEATFTYLCDVYVLEQHRGLALGKALMQHVMADPLFHRVRRSVLVTRDAHSLYQRHGFTALGNAQGYMEISRPGLYQRDTAA
jgi:PhzF family phenazine biosynthesis protein